MASVLLLVAVLGYALSVALAAMGTRHGSRPAYGAASATLGVAWAAHLASLILYSMAVGRLPLANVAEYLMVLGWAVATLQLYVWFRLQSGASGLLMTPIAAVATFTATTLLLPDPPPGPGGGPLFLVHTSVSTIGMAILGLACAMAVLYLVQDNALKSRKALRLLSRLPALESCDRLGYQALVAGFLMLTFGIATGLVVNAVAYDHLWLLDAKVVFPVMAWVIFATVLGLRTLAGVRGRRSAYLTIAGFAVGLMTILGMTF